MCLDSSIVTFLFLKCNVITFKICVVRSCFFDQEALDEMGNRIDELEQSINDLRAEMGQEGTPSPSTMKPKEEPKSADESA